MTSAASELPESHTKNDLVNLLKRLSSSQLRFVTRRIWTDTDAEAARQIGVSPRTVAFWKQGGAPIDEVVRLMKEDGVLLAAEMFRRALLDAVEVKLSGLEHRDVRVRQAAATEIIERVLGKPLQRQELSGGITVVLDGPGAFGD